MANSCRLQTISKSLAPVGLFYHSRTWHILMVLPGRIVGCNSSFSARQPTKELWFQCHPPEHLDWSLHNTHVQTNYQKPLPLKNKPVEHWRNPQNVEPRYCTWDQTCGQCGRTPLQWPQYVRQPAILNGGYHTTDTKPSKSPCSMEISPKKKSTKLSLMYR